VLTLDQVNQLNPWWTDPDWSSADDVHLSAAAAAPFRWDPRPFNAEDVSSGAVFTLRGLRQSGKTTLTKRLMADRVAAGHARRTCFLTLQTVTTADELREAIGLVLRLWPEEAGDWLFVLDELTFVANWARSIVYLREHDPAFRRATVLLTGSSAFDLATSADLLHGRRGRWPRPVDRLHMPMTFRDYVSARNATAVPVTSVALADLLTLDGREAVRVASLRTGELDQYLGEYIRSGGLPAPVTDLLADGRLAESTVMELWRGLSADARRLSRNDLVVRKLMARTVVALSSMTDWTTLMHELDVARPTVSAYVDVLAASFALIVLHQRDAKRQGGPALRRPRKLYFGDTALAAIPGMLGGPVATEGGLVENALAIALLRHAQRDALERFAHPDRLFYWRSNDGREIDFVVAEPQVLALESKYAERTTGKDYESITKAFGRGIMVTRRDVDVDQPVLTVPAGVLLALLG
jgi:predicted AAA+ superfamily ATPase